MEQNEFVADVFEIMGNQYTSAIPVTNKDCQLINIVGITDAFPIIENQSKSFQHIEDKQKIFERK